MSTKIQSLKRIVTLLAKRDQEPVITFYLSRDDKRIVTGRQLYEQIGSVMSFVEANKLAAYYPRIGLLLENSEHVPAIILGAMASGCIVVPLNPGAAPSDIEYICKNTELDMVIADEKSKMLAESISFDWEVFLASDIVSYPSRESVGRLLMMSKHDEEAPAIIMHTSGTTSKPKGVMLSSRSIIENAMAMSSWLRLDSDTQLTTLPMYHVHALIFGLFSSIVTNGRLVVLKSFEPLLWSYVMKKEQVNWTSVVPSLLPLVYVSGITKESCPDLRGIVVSSAPINEGMARKFEQRSSIPVLQAWGQTEFTCWATCCRSGVEGGEFDNDLRSVGAALDNVDVNIISNGDEMADEGMIGEIYLGGRYAMLGYWNEAELSNQTITRHGIKTGDLGYFKYINGEKHYFITGRVKEVINRNGEKISPRTIEDEIYDAFPNSAGYIAVVGFKHAYVGEEIGLFISRNLFMGTTIKRVEFIDYLREMHEAYRPRVIYISRKEISKTFTGKLQRAVMASTFSKFESYGGDFDVFDEEPLARSGEAL